MTNRHKVSKDLEELNILTEPNHHLQNTLPRKSRISVLFKHPENNYQNPAYPEPQNKPHQI